MEWHYVGEKIPDGDFVKKFLVSENGERFQIHWVRAWKFFYSARGRELNFTLVADTRRRTAEQKRAEEIRRSTLTHEMLVDHPDPEIRKSSLPDFDPSLGPDCSVHIFRIPNMPDDNFIMAAAKLLKSALPYFTLVPGAAPPPVERVRFFDDPLKGLSDYRD